MKKIKVKRSTINDFQKFHNINVLETLKREYSPNEEVEFKIEEDEKVENETVND